MADTQQIDTRPSGSLPADMLNPPDPLGFSPIPQAAPTPSSGLPQSHYDPIVASLAPSSPPPPQPTPTVPPAAPPPPASAAAAAPAPAPATPPPAPPPAAPAPPPSPAAAPAPAPSAPPPAAPAQPAAPAAAPGYTYIGDSLAAGLAGQQKAHQTYEGRDIPSARANGSILAASGRTTAETLRVLSANSSKLSGQNVVLSTGLSNDLNGGVPLDQAMTNVASQLDALRKAGANVTLLGVGAGVRDAQAANARLAQLAQAYGIPFTGEIADTQAADGQPGTVHPRNQNYGDVFKQVQASGPQAKGPAPDVLDGVVEHIRAKEAGGPFILVGHEGQPYDPKLMPVKPGYYGFPDWQGWGDSHAAGTGQFQPDTWKKAVEGIMADGNWTGPNPPDFRNPDDQWKVFRYWAGRRYKELTGSDLEADARAGKVNYGALGPEWTSLKGAGIGSPDEVTASTLPGFQNWQSALAKRQQIGEAEADDMQKRLAKLEAGSPEQRALADQLQRKMLQLIDLREKQIANPPTMKPHDMLSNFGSIATLIGIFAGRFANRPMVASLNAAGAAMEAINNNDRQAYEDAFKMWKTTSDMTDGLLTQESNTYKAILDDKRLSQEEQFKELEVAMKIWDNKQGIAAAEAANYQEMWKVMQQQEDIREKHALFKLHLEEANEKVEEARRKQQAETALDQAVAADDKAWQAAHPDATPEEIAQAHFDNLSKRQAQSKASTRAGTREAVQVTWSDGNTEVLYGQSGAPGHFVTESGRDVDLSGAKSVLPLTKAQAGGEAIALPDYKGPTQWEGMPSKPPPGIDRNVWSMALDWVRTGKQPTGMGRLDQVTREKLLQAYPVAQDALGIKPEDEYAQSIKYAAEKAREESIERGFGSGVMGRNLIALNTVADHIALFRQYADALRNHDTQRLNQLQNRLATETGSPEIINFALAGRITGDEVVRLLTTTGGTVTDREDIATRLASYDSPEQLQGAADTLTNYVRGRYAPLRQQYARGDPEKERYFDEKMVTPEAHQLFTGPPRPINSDQPPPTTPPPTGSPPPPATAAPPRPANVPAGSAWSPSRGQWRDPSGKIYDQQGSPVQ